MSAPRGSPPAALTLDVNILGRDYKVACREDEREALAEAVTLLDRRMREIRESGRINGSERIAVMAALNLASELLRERRTASPSESGVAGLAASGGAIDEDAARRRIRAMQQAIDQALAGQEKLF